MCLQEGAEGRTRRNSSCCALRQARFVKLNAGQCKLAATKHWGEDGSAPKLIDKEKDKETGLSNFGVRNYDDGLGRFMSIDPLWEKYRSLSPYNYSANNPMGIKDADGKALNFLIGAAVGMAADIAFQVTVNIVTGKDWYEIDPASVLVSAAAGAIGVGLAAKIHKLEKLGKNWDSTKANRRGNN